MTGKFTMRRRGSGKLIHIILYLSLPCLPYPAFAQLLPASSAIDPNLPNAPSEQPSSHNSLGSISGIIVDRDGAFIPNAHITLTGEDPAASNPAAVSGADGSFLFSNIPPGSFKLTIAAAGFTIEHVSATLHPGESYPIPPIPLSSSVSINVQVTASREEVAQAQIEDQEKQRVLGIIPNFFVSYEPNPVPLTSKQKFELSWKSAIDPVSFATAGIFAGIQQSDDDFSGYGQGAQGYGKRFAASYGDALIGNMLGNAILPSILKQDPRYFYKATGSIKERTLYALANAFICKGDNGNWQFNYSGMLGTVAASGISNIYYPHANRNGAALTFENLGIGIGGSAISNLFQEFLIPRLTPHKPPLPQS
jgi:Carboxypeptidase regulatory-like domain